MAAVYRLSRSTPMTTQQIDRPLSDVDETAERLQGLTGPGSDEATRDRPSTQERPAWDTRPASDLLQRLTEDPASMLRAAVVGIGVLASIVILVAFFRASRPAPRPAEELLLERSREAFDRARETLETVASRLSSIDR
jgi:hypothetical protein